MAADDNAYTKVVQNDGNSSAPTRTDGWAVIRGLLHDGSTRTVDDFIEATGLNRNTVKGLVYYALKAGRLRTVRITRRVEVAPDTWLVRKVRADQMNQQDTRKGTHR